MSLFRLLCSGLVIHLIFLISIFDIYFKSPIISDISPVPNTVVPLGKRVVFISVDGLRVDSLFDKDPITGKFVAEYVQDIIKNRGSWGVSQSHVPTESRPGHVAMLAGFYEDPSAVTKGWKENPVDFDSIFNRSHCSFAWGSPDILNIFFKGLKHDCAFMESYANEQNFAGDTRKYDNWVFRKLEKFMKFSKHSSKLYNEGIFFFLHLLGQDTSGHSDKPHTIKYRLNLKNVDELVRKIENLFYEFYGDDRTSFIFTSDHGMTDWGSHGAGDLEELNTPFVSWGAGIKKPTTSQTQLDIEQADITPLLAILLGCSIPVNSVGTLPISYLNFSRRQIAEAALLNAKQVAAQYLKALQNTEKYIISSFYIPFKKLLPENLERKLKAVSHSIKLEKYTVAVIQSKEILETGLEGLYFYQNYYQRPLLICISLSYLAWTLYLLLELFEESARKYDCPKLKCILICVVSVTFWLLSVQRLPFSFYFYALLPEFLWYFVIKKIWALQHVIENMKKMKCFYFFLCSMFGTEVLVISFFHRWLMVVAVAGILLWSLSSLNFKSKPFLMSTWLLSGCALGVFSLLPIVGGQPKPLLVTFSGIALCLLSFSVFWCSQNIILFIPKFIALTFSVWNSFVVHSHFNKNQELLNFNQYISWFLLSLCLIFLLTGRGEIFDRLHQIFVSLAIPFLLLSITHEGFFLFFLYIHLFCWIFVEQHISDQNPAITEFRIAYFFLAYIFLSFFGLGNTSSVNSFDPAWVRCFLTVFSPFLMSALILFKTAIPFLVVTCTMRVVTVTKDIQPGRLFITVLIYCNLMGMNFLFLVKNKGSWKDIGTSISHYVIQQVTIVFLVIFFGIAKFLTKYSLQNIEKGKTPKSKKMFFELEKMFSLPTFYSSSKHHGL